MLAVFITWALLMIAIWLSYNNLVSKRNRVDNAYGALDSMLKKRYDLLPNLISIVKMYMEHEKSMLDNIEAWAEKRLAATLNIDEKHKIDAQVAASMRILLTEIKNNPKLNSDNQFSRLQASWNEAEEQIAAARRAYNSAVTEYNTAYEGFPGNMFAKNMKFIHKDVLETDDDEKQNISAGEIFAS